MVHTKTRMRARRPSLNCILETGTFDDTGRQQQSGQHRFSLQAFAASFTSQRERRDERPRRSDLDRAAGVQGLWMFAVPVKGRPARAPNRARGKVLLGRRHGLRRTLPLDEFALFIGNCQSGFAVREAGAPSPGSQAVIRTHAPRLPGWPSYSTVTDLARLRGWSTSVPRTSAVWYARSCNGNAKTSGATKVGMSGRVSIAQAPGAASDAPL